MLQKLASMHSIDQNVSIHEKKSSHVQLETT